MLSCYRATLGVTNGSRDINEGIPSECENSEQSHKGSTLEMGS